ncbi:MAG: phosphomannomutase [Planctomycetota bacterium]|jgi:phosphomannomutase
MTIRIEDLMSESGVKFGTSGARGLADAITDRIAYAYTLAFLQPLESTGGIRAGASVAIAGDLRPSTPRIMAAAGRAVTDKGYRLINSGFVPSPAVANLGLRESFPTVMVTGSHIPDDRNGIKYTRVDGEIMKEDELGIKAQAVELPADLNDSGMFAEAPVLPEVDTTAAEQYIQRYVDAFGPQALAGMELGLYQHSAVGRDILKDLYEGLGAEVTCLGRSHTFIPVDTEAIREEDVALAEQWGRENDFFAILSTDGDSDRPLIADESGKWLRGDVAGILAAQYLKAEAVVTPVSCNSAVEKCGRFAQVIRTRIGSPYVIAGMKEAEAKGARPVVGYEANGGFLLQTPVSMAAGELAALPTRDAVLIHIAILLLAKQQGCSVAALTEGLPQRFTASDRLQEFPTEKSQAKLAEFDTGDASKDAAVLGELFGALSGTVESIDRTDGVRITFQNAEVIHLRPSGNAPELRCYTEADSEDRAVALNRACIEVMNGWR